MKCLASEWHPYINEIKIFKSCLCFFNQLLQQFGLLSTSNLREENVDKRLAHDEIIISFEKYINQGLRLLSNLKSAQINCIFVLKGKFSIIVKIALIKLNLT